MGLDKTQLTRGRTGRRSLARCLEEVEHDVLHSGSRGAVCSTAAWSYHGRIHRSRHCIHATKRSLLMLCRKRILDTAVTGRRSCFTLTPWDSSSAWSCYPLCAHSSNASSSVHASASLLHSHPTSTTSTSTPCPRKSDAPSPTHSLTSTPSQNPTPPAYNNTYQPHPQPLSLVKVSPSSSSTPTRNTSASAA